MKRATTLRNFHLTGFLAVTAAVSCPAWTAHASTCQDVCPGTGACSFNGTKTVTAVSVLDCGTRAIMIGSLGNLRVVGGGPTLVAGSLTVEGTNTASGAVAAVEGSGSVPGGLDIQLSGGLNLVS